MNRTSLFRAMLAATLSASALLVGCGPPADDPNQQGACSGRVAGDLVITEFMANPAGTDTGKEYFELYNATGSEISLAGITVRYSRGNGSAEKKTRLTEGVIPPGGYYVLGDVREGELPAHVDGTYGDKLGAFNNSDGKLAVLCGTTLIDEITYSSPVKENTARVFDGSVAPDAIANDDESKWCDATEEAHGFFGSPGAANPACEKIIDPTSCTGYSAGDLVITEILANPAGADEGNEYIELYNARGSAADLAGVTLRYSRLNGTAAKQVQLGEATIPAGGYFVLGDVRGDELPAHVDLSYGAGLGALGNTDGIVSLLCGETLIDEVRYESAKEGAAWTFDGALTPDAEDNDDPAKWCHATESAGDFFGTPGAANGACPVACSGIVAGDLVITEFMANPAGADEGKEYFEVYNARGSDVDLTGVILKLSRRDGSSAKEFRLEGGTIPSGKYYVFGDVRTEPLPSHIDQSYGSALGAMSNTDGRISIICGSTEVDAIEYTGAPENRARVFDGSRTPDAIENDDEGAWCTAQHAFGDFFGSPRATNESCAPTIVGCIDPDSGEVRDPVPPAPGRLIITEVMADPKAADDAGGEYIELHALDDMDLNDVVISKGSPTSSSNTRISSASGHCIAVQAGAYVVLTKKMSPDDNGGIPAPLQTHTIALTNTEGATLFLTHKSTVIDQATYPKPVAGVAAELSGDRLDATSNDSEWAFCEATSTFGAGDKGTPGLPNGICPAPVGPGECYDTVAGQTRSILRPSVGDLVITEVMASPTPTPGSPPSDRPREWFEVVALQPFDLNEVEFGNESGGTVSLIQKECATTAAGQYLLFAQSVNASLNGGLPTPDLVFDFDLANAASITVPEPKVVVRSQGVELDSFAWTDSTLAASDQLSASAALDPASNDGTANRCATPVENTYGPDGTERGTPKAPNVDCP